MLFHRRKNNFDAFLDRLIEPRKKSQAFWPWFLFLFFLTVFLAIWFSFKSFNDQVNRFMTATDFSVAKNENSFLAGDSFWSLALSGLADDFYDLFGFNGSKRYLLLLQNNMEMRPTGGFIGSYGLVTIENGRIKNFFIDDVYNLDKQSEGKLKITAPTPMKKYNRQEWWFMRDANWSPDWPTAAEKILWFFNEESRNAGLVPGKIDGVLAITPNIIADLISLSGPIEVNGRVFTAANFAVELERFVEFDYRRYDIGAADRKDIIGEIASALIQNTEGWPMGTKLKAFGMVKKSLDDKQILFYATDGAMRQKIADYGWSGEVKKTDGDYLMVVDANLAALKTDLVMEKSLSYGLRLAPDGGLVGRIEAVYRHHGDGAEGLISRYRNFVRVYLPEGSILSAAAIKRDEEVSALDLERDVERVAEANKISFGVFLTVERGKEATLILEYLLPSRLAQDYLAGRYRLTVQKQPGTIGHKLQIRLNLNKPIVAYQAWASPNGVSNKGVWWSADLSSDRIIQLKF